MVGINLQRWRILVPGEPGYAEAARGFGVSVNHLAVDKLDAKHVMVLPYVYRVFAGHGGVSKVCKVSDAQPKSGNCN